MAREIVEDQRQPHDYLWRAKPTMISAMRSTDALLDMEALNLSSRILKIIDRYSLKTPVALGRQISDKGRLKFMTMVYNHVKARHSIDMCLPAFPFKSPNAKRKVLGRLPDKAEEFALAHLNGLCLAIGDVYSPGAKLTIVSDGLVYNGEFSKHPTTHQHLIFPIIPTSLLLQWKMLSFSPPFFFFPAARIRISHKDIS